MRLSDHFTLAELCHSQVAQRHGIHNMAPEEVVPRLQYLARHLLEPLRKRVGGPFSPTSGYRCLELNRLIGSSRRSQHLRGEAVDLKIPGIGLRKLAGYIRCDLAFDQLILEYHKPEDPDSGWLHCSLVDPALGRNNRHEALIFDGRTYREMDDVISVPSDH